MKHAPKLSADAQEIGGIKLHSLEFKLFVRGWRGVSLTDANCNPEFVIQVFTTDSLRAGYLCSLRVNLVMNTVRRYHGAGMGFLSESKILTWVRSCLERINDGTEPETIATKVTDVEIQMLEIEGALSLIHDTAAMGDSTYLDDKTRCVLLARNALLEATALNSEDDQFLSYLQELEKIIEQLKGGEPAE